MKTFLKSIKEDENMFLKNKTLLGGWILIAVKACRRDKIRKNEKILSSNTQRVWNKTANKL